MSGPLAVALTANIEPFDKAMARASDLAVKHAADIAGAFQGAAGKLNVAFNGIASLQKLPAQMNAAKAAAIGVAGTGALILASYALVSSSIRQANEQLDRFIDLGAKAASANIGVEFFQGFSAAAEKAKLDANQIEAALKRAGAAVTPKFDEQDAIKTRLDQLFQSGYLGQYDSRGLADYRAAGDNEQRIRAAVTAMQELEQLGERVAAIDLAERLFGPETAERIRAGRLEIDAIAASLDRKREDIITQEQVQKAEDFREALNNAYAEIDKALHVSIALGNAGQTILDVWLKIVQQTAAASTSAGGFLDKMLAAAKAAAEASRASLQSPLTNRPAQEGEGNLAADLGAVAGRRATDNRDAARRAAEGIAGREIYGEPIGPNAPTMTIADPPAPPRRPLSFYTDPPAAGSAGGGAGGKSAAPTASESLDAVQTYVNSLTRSTVAIKAEVDAIGLSNTEKLAAINLAKAEELAKQNNITLTTEQITKIKETSIATVEYREKLEEVRDNQEHLRSISNSVLGGIVSDARNGVTALQALYNAVNRVLDRLADKAVNSLTDMLFGSSGGTEGGFLTSLFKLGASAATGGTSGGLDLAIGSDASFIAKDGHVPGFATGRVPGPGGTKATLTRDGILKGPGTPTSDSILARLSTDEAIIRASSVEKYGPDFIRTINEGTFDPAANDQGKPLPGYATGRVPQDTARRIAAAMRLDAGTAPPLPSGGAGAASMSPPPASTTVVSVAPVIHLTASGGTTSQNTDLAEQVVGRLDETIRGIVGQELRAAQRPGGMLRR